jgi:hypothetical protein
MQKSTCTRSRWRLSRHLELYIRIFLVYMTVLYFCALHVKYETKNARRTWTRVHGNHSRTTPHPIEHLLQHLDGDTMPF